jgi:predicted secreted protein
MVLPIGVRSQDEAGDVEPGTPAGAPEHPMIGRKMIWATVGAAGVWLILFGIIEGRVITRDDIRFLAPFD